MIELASGKAQQGLTDGRANAQENDGDVDMEDECGDGEREGHDESNDLGKTVNLMGEEQSQYSTS